MQHQSRPSHLLRFVLVGLLLTAPFAYGADSATIIQATPLRTAPEQSAESRQLLRQGEQVSVLRRQAGWVQVTTTGGVTGWAHMTGLRLAAPRVSARAGGFFRWFGGGARVATNETANVTIGVRGISAADLAQAQPNLAALAQMEAIPSGAAIGNRFGAQRQLTAQTVDYLAVPPGAAS
ncbi:MAG: SH3 domain-containing protein [Pseudomonadota bacterium]|nr:SH3 domain-containing protein [Pseudomonadota bacterium]